MYQGEIGRPGSRGIPGKMGPAGSDGSPGEPGDKGDGGQDGRNGARGTGVCVSSHVHVSSFVRIRIPLELSHLFISFIQVVAHPNVRWINM